MSGTEGRSLRRPPDYLLGLVLLFLALGAWADVGRELTREPEAIDVPEAVAPPAVVAPPKAVRPTAPVEAVEKPPAVEARGKIRVVEHESDMPLPDARVHWLEEHPERRSTTLRSVPQSTVPGEFLYEGPAGVVLFSVEAPGHVGTHHSGLAVEVPRGGRLSHVFRLERAGSLRLRFQCEGRPANPESVLIRLPMGPRRGGVTGVGISIRDGTGERDDLEEGTYGIEVRPGPGYEPVAIEHVEILKEETTERLIELVKLGSSDRSGRDALTASVRGTVRLHAGWGDRNTRVRVFDGVGGRDAAEWSVVPQRDTPDGPRRFDFGRLPVGDYWIEVQPQWRRKVEVPPEGAVLDLDVPEPATVRVRVVEEASGKPVLGSRLFWHCPVPGLNSYTSDSESPDPRTGEFRFQVPPGELAYRVTARGWIPVRGGGNPHHGAEASDRTEPGRLSEFTIRLRPAGSIRVLVRCDGKPLSKSEVEVTLILAEELDGHGPGSVTQWLNGGPGLFRLEDLAPVKYVLDVRDLSGRYQPVLDRIVQILPGRVVESVVDLERRK